MIIHPGVMGIDISKEMLDVFDAGVGRPERIANVTADVEALARRCAAALAQGLQPAPQDGVPAERARLVLLHKRRDQLVATRQQERARRSECSDGEIAADLDRHLDWLDAEIKTFERRIRDVLAAQAELVRLQALLRSAPGIGPVAAATLIALLPELGLRSAKTIAALAGLAPFNRDSGRYRGQRSIRGGRKRVRDALYMAALTAARSQSPFRALYTRLRQAGKPAKLALIAVARKLLVTLNAMVRDQKAFQNP